MDQGEGMEDLKVSMVAIIVLGMVVIIVLGTVLFLMDMALDIIVLTVMVLVGLQVM